MSTARSADDLLVARVVWTHTGDAEFPYAAEVDGRRFVVRINDFPAEPLYTLMSEDQELVHLDDWPKSWEMPSPPKELLDRIAPGGKKKG